MNDDHLSQLSELESEFTQEVKGEGSLSPYIVRDPANAAGNAKQYVGYDIHPENIEALYFEGLQVPRWESIEAETVAQQEAIYLESFQKSVSDYPLISRVSDTDQKVTYSPDEVIQLREECERVLKNTAEPKAIKALQKFYLACSKAAEQQSGLLLIPS